MISTNRIKQIKLLHQKKYRQQNKQFIVEGFKLVNELQSSLYIIDNIYVTTDFKENINFETITISAKEMQRISGLKTPNNILAVVNIPEQKLIDISDNLLILCLDNIQDPGNFGTIIRSANWFGIKTIVCSLNTVELYNQKVLQSTMGAFVETQIVYTDLAEFLYKYKGNIYGTFLEGENIYKQELKQQACIVMGNEGKGISQEIAKYITHKLYVPSTGKVKAESLNVSIATAVILAEFRRKNS